MEFMVLMILLVFGMPVGELFILVWFIKKGVDLHNGKADFKVSKSIPIIYLVCSVWVAMMIMTLEFPMAGLVVPIATREGRALGFLVLANLTTPLFPILERMKRRTIDRMTQQTLENPSQDRL